MGRWSACLWVVAAAAIAVPSAQAKEKYAVMPTQLDETSKGLVPDLFDDYLLTAIQNAGDFDVIGQEDIAAMLGFEKQKDNASEHSAKRLNVRLPGGVPSCGQRVD